jgi:hypothetical protein
MKRLFVASLLVLSISAAGMPAARAEEHDVYRTEPFNLVFLGYQGFFESQGIPSNGAFVSAIQSHRVTAEDLVRGAIAQGKLPKDTLNDEEYLNVVELQLEDFASGDN